MKRILKIILVNATFIILFICTRNNIAYGAGRLVDIPIPPNSWGYADFTSEEGEQQEKEYKEQQEKNAITAEEFIGKSDNNYLKKLEIEGYQIEPQFDAKVNDYVLKLKDKSILSKLNIIAEAEDEKTKIQGNGIIEIKDGQKVININVIAENSNLNVYTINIKNENNYEDEKLENKTEKETLEETEKIVNNEQEQVENEKDTKGNKVKIIIIFIIVFIILVVVIIVIFKSNKRGKHNI